MNKEDLQEIYLENQVLIRVHFITGVKSGGMENQELKRLKDLEAENLKLKQMFADISLDNKMLKDILSKKF